MKLHELQSVRRLALTGYSVTRTAELFHTSQPGVSRHVLGVEAELGIDIFSREKNRIVGLTVAGDALMPLLERVLESVDDLRETARRLALGEEGTLSIAASHTHLRHLLPPVIKQFGTDYPKVSIRLRHGRIPDLIEAVANGHAEICLSGASSEGHPDVVFEPYSELHRLLIVPKAHPLLDEPTIRLEDIAAWPLITYEKVFLARAEIMGVFHAQGLRPHVAVAVGDTDVMKTYVRCGLGIAIIPSPAYEADVDADLAAIDIRHLFPKPKLYYGLRRGRKISAHAHHFIRLLQER